MQISQIWLLVGGKIKLFLEVLEGNTDFLEGNATVEVSLSTMLMWFQKVLRLFQLGQTKK